MHRRLVERAEQRMERLARHEVDRAVLHLHEHVRLELPVQPRELEIGPLGPIGIDILVVDERPPDDRAAVRRERVGEHVGPFGVAAAVVLRAGLPFGVRLDREAAEVRDQRVDLVDLALPPRRRRPDRAGRRSSGRPGAAGPRRSRTDTAARRTGGTHSPAPRPWPGSRATGPATSALTLLTTAPLIPIDALARA